MIDPSGDLVGNPGFEVDTSGWKGDASANTLTRVSGGHSGGWAVEMSNSNAGGKCGIDDEPNWVGTSRGRHLQREHVGALRHPRSHRQATCPRIRRRCQAGIGNGSIVLTTAWQQVNQDYTTVAPGSSTVNVEAYTTNSPVGRASKPTTHPSP